MKGFYYRGALSVLLHRVYDKGLQKGNSFLGHLGLHQRKLSTKWKAEMLLACTPVSPPDQHLSLDELYVYSVHNAI